MNQIHQSMKMTIVRTMTLLFAVLTMGLIGVGCDDGPGTEEPPPGGGDGSNPAPTDYGESCVDEDGCGEQTACFFYDDELDDKICTYACDTNADCPSDVFSSCADVGKNGKTKKVCVPHNLSPFYGDVCDLSDPDACGTSATCHPYSSGSEDAFCSFECSSDNDCPKNVPSSCLSLDSDQGLINLCVPDDLCIDPDGDEYGAGPGCKGFDCNQNNKDIHPGATEYCDGIDNDCNGEIDDNVINENRPCETGLPGLCQDGEYKCRMGTMECQARVLPGERQELCDGIDNDCDGLVDEGPSFFALQPDGTLPPDFDPNNPTPPEDGTLVDENNNYVIGIGRACGNPDSECFSGYQYCDATSFSLQCSDPRDDMENVPDLCDGIDNNCNGQIDEDTHLFDPENNLGKPCFAGGGTCRGAGRYVCDDDPAAKPVCNAVPRPENAAKETCDYTDEDCDDVVDNDFVDENGVYARIDNCGRCHNDCRVGWGGDTCTDGDLQSFGELDGQGNPIQRATSATCASTGSEIACVVTGSSAQCEQQCMNGYYDLDRVPSNGCEFRPDTNAIYVATPEPKENPLIQPGANSSSCGAFDKPCATIGYALGRAGDAGKSKIFVSEGIYDESLTMVDGISVIGGYSSRNWLLDPVGNATTLKGGMELGDKHVTTVLIDGITKATEFSGFTIDARNAGPSGNSYGIYIKNANSQLTVKDNTVVAGRGGVGSSGANGASGDSGGDGGDGLDRSNWNNSCSGTPIMRGGTAGTASCGTPTNGGTGADMTVCPGGDNNPEINSSSDRNKQNGQGAGAGSGGQSSKHTTTGTITQGVHGCASGTGASSPGTNGTKGNDGNGGQGAGSAAGSVAGNGFWSGASGGVGNAGSAGSGGGGGGSSGGIREDRSGNNNYYYHYGPTGGGGGAGGCGGSGGTGGSAGGGSFGIFVVVASGGAPTLSHNHVILGQGGRGGTGGAGGAGGAGGTGGEGGTMIAEPRPGSGSDNVSWSRCGQHGQRGGAGGRGGHGGGGGGGAGGVAYGIAVSGGSANYQSDNTFDTDAGGAGAGGAGGSGIAHPGQQGASGEISGFKSF